MSKYGEISNLAKEIAAEKQQDGEKNTEGAKEVEGQIGTGADAKDTKVEERAAMADSETKEYSANGTSGGTSILEQQVVKKTVEIKLVFDVAIENIKADRKKKNRFQKHSQAMTNNGIINEMLAFYFAQPENRRYAEAAQKELSEM